MRLRRWYKIAGKSAKFHAPTGERQFLRIFSIFGKISQNFKKLPTIREVGWGGWGGGGRGKYIIMIII